jgi:hypothetical protein
MLTWSEAKTSYGTLIRAGFPQDVVKATSPLCRRCAAIMVRLEINPRQVLRREDFPTQH